VTVMQAFAAGKFPDTLDGVEFRTVMGQVAELELFTMQSPPVLVEFSMMVPGVIQYDHDTSS